MTGAVAVFNRVFGADPDGVWAAPGRVNLIGEHTDYNDGLVLPFALAERTDAAIALRSDGHIRICSAQNPGEVVEMKASNLAPGLPSGWAAYVAGVPWALGTTTGFDIAVDSSVPVGSGLSSSAALMCSVGIGLDELLGLGLSRRELARKTRSTENDYVGAPTGGMDQVASLMCTEGHALLYDVQADTTEQIPFDPTAAGLVILAVDSMVRHGHSDSAYRDRREDCEAAAEILGVKVLREVNVSDLEKALPLLNNERISRRTKHIVTENQRVIDTAAALDQKRWLKVGELLTEAHASYRDDFEASCEEVDVAVDLLLAEGAVGARLTGGGFGGVAISLMPTDRIEVASAAVESAYSTRGYTAPNIFTVAPSAGAGRIE